MKRALTTGILVAALSLAGVQGAYAATPTEKKLQRQITVLQKDVKKLKADLKDAQDFSVAVLAFSACNAAVSADALQGTWGVLDQVASTQAKIGPQQAVNDSGACQALRVPRSAVTPPTLTPFHALLNLLAFRSLTNAVHSFVDAVALRSQD